MVFKHPPFLAPPDDRDHIARPGRKPRNPALLLGRVPGAPPRAIGSPEALLGPAQEKGGVIPSSARPVGEMREPLGKKKLGKRLFGP